MTYLLDTDIASRFKRASIPAKLESWLRSGVVVCLSGVALAEMKYGAQIAPAEDREELETRIAGIEADFVDATEWPTMDVLVRWKQLQAELKTINRTMTCEDSLVAATALARDLTLATNNTRHFLPAEQFGLKLFNPLA